MVKSFEEWQAQIRAINEANGWFDTDRSFGEGMALLHSEVSEAFEAYRDWGLADATAIATASSTDLPKPEGVGSELADVFIRLMDEVERTGISLEYEVNRKLIYNSTRGYRHGGKNV